MVNAHERQKNELSFGINHSEFLKKYGKNIPEPSPDLKLCIVVPSSAEMGNDNFWRMLRSFLLQRKGTSFSEFELVIVVNNPQLAVDAAKKKDASSLDTQDLHEQTKLNPEKLASRYRDNQLQLNIISLIRAGQELKASGQSEENVWKAIKTKLNPLPLTEYELDLVRQAINKDIRIRGIDASSDKKALSALGGENPVARSRNIGGHIAYERLTKTIGAAGIVDYLDADCFVNPKYVQTMIASIGKSEAVLKPMLSVITEIPKTIADADPVRQFISLVSYVRHHYFDYPLSYPSMTLGGKDYLGGPQVGTSAEVFKANGGYPQKSHDADFAFSIQILSEYTCTLLPSALVYVADREREGSVDGGNRTTKINTAFKRDVFANKPWTGKLVNAIRRDHALETNLKVGDAYKEFRRKRFRQEVMSRRFFQSNAKEVLAFILRKYNKIKSNLASDYLHSNSFNVAEKILNRRQIDYLQQNPVIVEAVLLLFKMIDENPDTIEQVIGYDPQKTSKDVAVLAVLQAMIPEHFAEPPDKEPDYEAIFKEVETSNKKAEELNPRDFLHINLAANDAAEAFPDIRGHI